MFDSLIHYLPRSLYPAAMGNAPPKRLLWSWLVAAFLACVLILGIPISAAAGPEDSFAKALDDQMPALLAKYGVPGAVVSSIEAGEVPWTKAFGLSNLKPRAPMRPDMFFN